MNQRQRPRQLFGGAVLPAALSGGHAGDETATLSFNLAPSASVLTVTHSDGSVGRYVTIEEGAVDEPPALAPNVERQPAGHRPDRNRHRRQRIGVAVSAP